MEVELDEQGSLYSHSRIIKCMDRGDIALAG